MTMGNTGFNIYCQFIMLRSLKSFLIHGVDFFFFLLFQMSWLASLKNCHLRNISLYLRNRRYVSSKRSFFYCFSGSRVYHVASDLWSRISDFKFNNHSWLQRGPWNMNQVIFVAFSRILQIAELYTLNLHLLYRWGFFSSLFLHSAFSIYICIQCG